MEPWRLDDLARRVASRTSRRAAATVILSVILLHTEPKAAAAKHKHRRKHRHHHHQHGATCRGIFWACKDNSDCCLGTVCGGTFSPEEFVCQAACTSDADCFALTHSHDVSCDSFPLACGGPCCVRKSCLSAADCPDTGLCCGNPSLCCFPGEKCNGTGCVPV